MGARRRLQSPRISPGGRAPSPRPDLLQRKDPARAHRHRQDRAAVTAVRCALPPEALHQRAVASCHLAVLLRDPLGCGSQLQRAPGPHQASRGPEELLEGDPRLVQPFRQRRPHVLQALHSPTDLVQGLPDVPRPSPALPGSIQRCRQRFKSCPDGVHGSLQSVHVLGSHHPVGGGLEGVTFLQEPQLLPGPASTADLRHHVPGGLPDEEGPRAQGQHCEQAADHHQTEASQKELASGAQPASRGWPAADRGLR